MAGWSLLWTIIFAVILKSACGKSPYYADLTYQNGSNNSCASTTLFATSNDPFYGWVSQSDLALGFDKGLDDITNQQAAIAYRKLSTWRVAKQMGEGSTLMFNSPEPHVLGGSFRHGKHDIVTKMDVNWGVSIRICAYSHLFDVKGPNLCRSSSQVIASYNGTAVVFKSLMTEVPYWGRNGSISDVTYLANWVSNANVPIAVEKNETVAIDESTYYWNSTLPSCEPGKTTYDFPDLTGFLDNYTRPQCICVGDVCVKRAYDTVNKGVFADASGCKVQNSYWFPSEEVLLFSYSKILHSYYIIYSNLNSSSFPESITEATITNMTALQVCFENQISSDENGNHNSTDISCTDSGAQDLLLLPNIYRYSDNELTIAFSVSLFSKNIISAAESGDNCKVRAVEDKLCSLDLLTDEEKDEVKLILKASSQLEEVRKYAAQEWQNQSSERHNVYLDILTAILSMFVATILVFSKRVVRAEKWLFGQKLEALKEQNGIGLQLLKFVRWLVRLVILGGVVANCVWVVWHSFSELERERYNAWSQTSQYQPTDTIAFLVTTTSTIEVKTMKATLYVIIILLLAYFLIMACMVYFYINESPLACLQFLKTNIPNKRELQKAHHEAERNDDDTEAPEGSELDNV